MHLFGSARWCGRRVLSPILTSRLGVTVAGAARLSTPFDHATKDSDEFRSVFETLIIHAFLGIVNVCDGLLGELAACICIVQAIVQVGGVF